MTKNGDSDISREMRELKKLLKQIPPERQAVAQSLYQELVFMQGALGALKQQIRTEGPVSDFKQGKQQFLREHPALKGYSKLIKNYGVIYKQLCDLLPKTTTGKGDALMDFLKKG